ncbi:MAG: nitroreductase family protein [Syntrophaceae bacterium]|nr:nitroreductase family protein [Deltaproteobacteria bacterium]
MIRDLVTRNRSFRRFHQDHHVGIGDLRELADLARLCASAGNRQPLKYVLSNEAFLNAVIFEHLGWAAFLKDWLGPAEGERPSAYIVILGDREITGSFGIDAGIAAQTIMLGAVEKDLGGCMIASVDRKGLAEELLIPERYEILLVIALGKPGEEVRIEEMVPGGDIRYWRDSDGVHHVPKRPLDEIILKRG